MSKIKINKLQSIIVLLFVVFCIQFTDFKIGVIKVAEILLLLLTPFIYFKTINKWILYFLLLFTLWFVVSILINPFREFYLLEGVSALKQPYFITIGRYLELIACVNLAALTYRFLKRKTYEEVISFIKSIFKMSFILLLFNMLIYALYNYDIISGSRMIYHGGRFRGWFAEGGPYGLMLSFTFCLSFFYKNKYNNLLRSIIFIVILFFAQSKAGVLLILVWLTIVNYKKLYTKIKQLNIIVIVFGGIVISLVFVKLADNYINGIKNIKQEVIERPTDINLVMGRIAGVFIFPKMVADNPVLGIGLGNYPIVRNNPKYLGIIPPSPKGETDAHGFGGIFQLLVDGGIFILTLFFTVLYSFFKQLKGFDPQKGMFLFIFLCFFAFGVQIYFMYPWVLLGLLISLSEKAKYS